MDEAVNTEAQAAETPEGSSYLDREAGDNRAIGPMEESDHAGDETSAYSDGARNEEEYDDVPFQDDPRWKEVIGKKKELEAELAGLRGFAPVIEHIKGLGFDSPESVTEALAAEQQRLFDAKLAQALNAEVRSGRIDFATAQARYQAAQQERRVSQSLASLVQYEVDRQLQDARREFPEMDEDLVREIGHANYGRPGFDIRDVARRSHERNLAFLERRLAGYEAERAEQPAAPLSSGRGTNVLTGNSKSALKRSWEDLLGLTKLAHL